MLTSDYKRIEACKVNDAKCYCGRRSSLRVFCGFYICSWCLAGNKVAIKHFGMTPILRSKKGKNAERNVPQGVVGQG